MNNEGYFSTVVGSYYTDVNISLEYSTFPILCQTKSFSKKTKHIFKYAYAFECEMRKFNQIFLNV